MQHIYKFYLSIIALLCINIGWAHDGHHPMNSGGTILFVPNEGQWDGPFKFKGLHSGADIFLEDNGITFRIGHQDNGKKIYDAKFGKTTGDQTLKYHVYKLTWKNALPEPQIVAAQKQSSYHNYYLGDDKSRWKTNVSLYAMLLYKNVYNNIDVKYYTEKDQLKYDYIVRPNGNPDAIAMEFEGLDGMSIKEEQLVLKTSVGNVIEMAPYSYQIINGEKKEVPAKFELKGNVISFKFPKGYNKQYDLVIDPTIIFASLSGSTSDNWGFTATYDPQGNLYAGGIARGLGYPVTLGAYQITFNGGTPNSMMPCDITLSKFNSIGNGLIYSTYLGGNEDDMPHSLVVDNNNDLILAGKTISRNFPVTSGAYQTTHGGGTTDIIITKFNQGGTALIGSTYLGGLSNDGSNVAMGFDANQNSLKYNYGDDSRSEVLVDNNGNIYVVGSTQSANFPTTATAAKSALEGLQDGIFSKFNPTLSTLIYSTLIGGNSMDAAYVMTFDKTQQNLYIAGGTQSTNFHTNVSMGTLNPNYQGGLADGFVVKFQNSGTYPMLRSTYIGTSSYDQCYGIQTDFDGDLYIMGQTTGNYPVTAGMYNNPNSPQFVHKLNNNLSATIFSTVFGNGNRTFPNLSLVAMLVDTCENIYIAGWGAGGITPGSTTIGLPLTSNALQSSTDGSDFYFFVLERDAQSLLYASYFGAAGRNEHVDGGTSRFDPRGIIYQAMCASCGGGTAFPSTPGAYSTQNRGPNCNIGVVKIAFNLGAVDAQAAASPSATGCAPLTVNFNNNSNNATQYFWEFGPPGATSTLTNPIYTYNNPGNYQVRLVAYNPNACKEWDTTFLSIVVRNDTLTGDFSYQKADTCLSFDVLFSNLTTFPSSLNGNSAVYRWDFGDNTTYVGRNPPVHTYPGYGTYNVRLTIEHPEACNAPKVIEKTISFIDNFVRVAMPPLGLVCINDPITITPTYTNPVTYNWDFGDGTTSTAAIPSHTYTTPGQYIIKVYVYNAQTCNQVDSAVDTINVYPRPTAMFSYTPMTPQVNVGTQFINESTGGDIYNWDFGDGRTSAEKDPYHEFFASGTYRVCLTVTNEAGCKNETCKNIVTLVKNIAEVPTGFSPNGDGKNDRVYVRGYNIETMDFKIFNRFGNLIFETSDINEGWDGTFNSTMQEMEVYGYTLDVTFRDGTKSVKKGNITMIK